MMLVLLTIPTGCGMTVTFGTDSICEAPFGLHKFSRNDTLLTRQDLAARNAAMRAIGCPEKK